MIKSSLLRLYLFYQKHFFVQRGKFFLSNFLYKALGDICIKADNGVYLYLKANSSMDLSYLDHNPTYTDIMEHIDKLNEGDVFVDIGANVGYFSFYAAKRVGSKGKVYAFEPSDREYERLLKGIEKNNLTNILPFNVALTDHKGVVEFAIEPFHTGLNAMAVSNNDSSSRSTIMKPCNRLDLVVKDTDVHLLKLDVEGAEYLVLKGSEALLALQKIKKLVVEVTPGFLKKFGSGKEELFDMMKSMGYKPTINSQASQYDEVFVPANAN
jgi:FkbM family methyltransferase